MRKILLFLFILSVLVVSCVGKTAIIKFSKVSPGMSCQDFERYLKGEDIPYKREKGDYKFSLDGAVWASVEVGCKKKIVDSIEFISTKGTSIRHSQIYTETERILSDAFRDNRIVYEEGSRTINFSNGVKLRQHVDAAYGTITYFAVRLDNVDGSAAAWEKVLQLLPVIGM